MKTIEVDEELYRYIVSHTQELGENASTILRRMLKFSAGQMPAEKGATKKGPQPAKTAEVAVTEAHARESRLRQLLQSENYAKQNRTVNRFTLVLSALYSLDAERFSVATESLRGRTRTYFANDEQTLLQHGNQTKPKRVAGTPYWVITNTNTSRKRSMIEYLMAEMQFPTELIDTVCGTL